jgi:hypothetical protein
MLVHPPFCFAAFKMEYRGHPPAHVRNTWREHQALRVRKQSLKGDVLISQPLKFSTKPHIASTRQSNATLLSFTNVAWPNRSHI